MQTSVNHRAGFVDTTPNLRHDAVNDLQQVTVVTELDVGFFHLTAAFAVDVLGAVDQDIADRRIFQKKLQWAKSEDFVHDLFYQAITFGTVEKIVLPVT